MSKKLHLCLCEVSGLMELKMYEEAWEILNALPLHQRRMPLVLLFRSLILIKLGRVEEAGHILAGLEPQRVMGKWYFHYVSALYFALQNNPGAAREHVSHAVQLNLDCRHLLDKAQELKSIW